jgi:dihydrolipoamide dehydrogenase
VYIIGDAKYKNIQLAHVASAQAENVVAEIVGKKPPLDMSVVPSCVYTEPEIASVGLTEETAKANGIAIKTGKYLTGANGKCLIEDTANGYVKLVISAEEGRILGAQLVCPRATDMVGELALAIQKELTVDDLASVIHPHPTFCEMLFGAAEGLRFE